MKKIITAILLGMLFGGFFGCSQPAPKKTPPLPKEEHTAHKPHTSHAMFQSVDKKDAVLVQSGEQKEHCARCGMNLVMFYKTSHMALTDEDGEKHQYCSLHCLVDHLNEGVELKNPKVVDVVTLKPIPVLEAYYVVGSDVPGTMSRVSKYAFSSLEAAQKFQKEHGGKIMDFNGALQEAKKDFQQE